MHIKHATDNAQLNIGITAETCVSSGYIRHR